MPFIPDRRMRAVLAVPFAAATLAHADTRATEPVTVLGEVMVDAESPDAPRFDPVQSTSTVGPDQLDRRQPENIFEAVRGVPGVSVNGGPRASGMTFSIRGYSDSEDVRVRLDGVTKQFEKYRFGGTFIEPELLKQIEVQRGPQITAGSGASGGTVSATTKDAADLLAPGQRFGAQAKAGYATNNNEWMASASAYGRPTAETDVLVNVLKRRSDDYTLPDGTAYRYSSTNTESALLKGGMFLLEDLRCSVSFVGFNDSGPQPYDATGGQPGVGGIVLRKVEDRTLSTTLNYEPGGRWINLRATAGYGHTRLHDLLQPGLSSFATPFPPGSGDLDDYYDYDIWNLDLANTSALGDLGGVALLSVTTGVQYEHNEREVERLAQNPAFNAPGGLYADGFNPAQPPGTKVNYAAYVQPRLEVGRLALVPGVRRDHYDVEAAGGTLALLAPYGQASKVSYDHTGYSFGASFDLVPRQFLVFYNYMEGFRPPLIDETFSQGIFGRCNALNLGALAPASRICGDLYQPEETTTQEVGLSLSKPGFWNADGALAAKATWFWSKTTNLLESITVESPGVIGQPGWEKRHGVEIQTSADAGAWFASVSYASVSGSTYTCPNFFCIPTLANQGLGNYPLYDRPGDTTTLTVGARFLGGRIEVAYNLTDVGARDVIRTGKLLGQPDAITRQDGYLLQGATARVIVTPHLEVRLNVENLTDETYYFYQGSYEGAQAPGRNFRLTVSAKY